MPAFHPRRLALAAALFVAACAPASPGPSGPALPATPPSAAKPRGAVINRLPAKLEGPAGKSLLAIYMIGSDLEDGGKDHPANGPLNTRGAGTTDFKEMVRGLKGLSAAERANLDLLVYFGGSTQVGWRGLTVIDAEGILKDAEDGYFGNHPDPSIYQRQSPGTDMGSGDTWKAFLQDVKGRQGGYAKVLVDMWNHGSSWNGMGPDSNTRGTLPVDVLGAGLKATNFKADLIGFDACLMASVEVAGAMAGHFKYMLASEELEPGHGWAYAELVGFLGQQPTATVPAIAKNVVDQFVEHSSHRNTSGKTLSLVDLETFQTQLAPAITSMSQDLAAPSHITAFSRANQKAQRYGVHNNVETSRDLGGLVAALDPKALSNAGLQARLKEGLEATVLYARDDGSKPFSYGLSIYSIGNGGDFNQGYTATRAFPQALFTTINDWFVAATEDQEAPKLELVDAKTLKPVARRLLQSPGDVAVRVADNLCITEVGEMHALLTAEGFALVGNAPAQELPEQPGVYKQAAWQGKSHYLVVQGKRVPLATTQELGQSGSVYYSAPILLNAEPATLSLEVNPQQEVVKFWVQLYLESGEPSREQHELVDGDLVEPLRLVYNAAEDQISVEGGTALAIQGPPSFQHLPVEGDSFAFIMAKDLNGNLNISDPVEAKAP